MNTPSAKHGSSAPPSARQQSAPSSSNAVATEVDVAYIDGKSIPNTVHNENKDADCTIAISLENLAALLSGELDPATGFMMGKFKVSGDMSVALKLQRVV
jgi:putative sterol carrier protein